MIDEIEAAAMKLFEDFHIETTTQAYFNVFKQLRAKGFTNDQAEYGALIAWINSYTAALPFSELEDVDAFIKGIEDDSKRKINDAAQFFKTREKKAKNLENEEIDVLKAVRHAELLGIPATKILHRNRSDRKKS